MAFFIFRFELKDINQNKNVTNVTS